MEAAGLVQGLQLGSRAERQRVVAPGDTAKLELGLQGVPGKCIWDCVPWAVSCTPGGSFRAWLCALGLWAFTRPKQVLGHAGGSLPPVLSCVSLTEPPGKGSAL